MGGTEGAGEQLRVRVEMRDGGVQVQVSESWRKGGGGELELKQETVGEVDQLDSPEHAACDMNDSARLVRGRGIKKNGEYKGL